MIKMLRLISAMIVVSALPAFAQEASITVEGNELLRLSRKPSQHMSFVGVPERKLEFLGPSGDGIEIARSDFWGSMALFQDSGHVSFGMGPSLSLHTNFPNAALSRHFYVSLGDPHNAPGTLSSDVVLQSWDGGFLNHVTHMVLKANGNVGIGALNPVNKLEVGGTVAATSFVNLSSRDYKEKIESVGAEEQARMLEAIGRLGIARYDYKVGIDADGGRHIGFIAEELPAEVLAKDGKAVDVYELLTYTIGAMKAQQRRIEELERQVAAVGAPAQAE